LLVCLDENWQHGLAAQPTTDAVQHHRLAPVTQIELHADKETKAAKQKEQNSKF